MNEKIVMSFTILCLVFACACSGGGEADPATSLSGLTYDCVETLVSTTDTCDFFTDEYAMAISFNQEGTTVIGTDDLGIVYSGTIENNTLTLNQRDDSVSFTDVEDDLGLGTGCSLTTTDLAMTGTVTTNASFTMNESATFTYQESIANACGGRGNTHCNYRATAACTKRASASNNNGNNNVGTQ